MRQPTAKVLDRHPFTRMLVMLVGLVAAGGILLTALYSWQEGSVTVFAAGALVASAASAVGALAGFLFGLPRFSPARAADAAQQATTAPRALSAASVLTPGTNLEQVSDWLTKLLLGAGLTQLGRLGGGFGSLTDVLARALTGASGAAPSRRHRTRPTPAPPGRARQPSPWRPSRSAVRPEMTGRAQTLPA